MYISVFLKFVRAYPYIPIIFAFLLGLTALQADTVILKSGGKITGKVVDQNPKVIKIKVKGSIRIVQKRNVVRVIYRSAAQEEALRKKREEVERKRREAARKKRIEAERKRREAARKKREEAERKRQEAARKKDEKKEPASKNISGVTRSEVLWRSALFPGRGQIYAGNRGPGLATMGIFSGSLLYSMNSLRQSRVFKTRYEDRVSQVLLLAVSGAALGRFNTNVLSAGNVSLAFNLEADKEYKAALERYNSGLTLAGFIYLGHLLYLYATTPEFPPEEANPTSFAPAPNQGLEIFLGAGPFAYESTGHQPENFTGFAYRIRF